MKTLITGAQGMLGSDLAFVCRDWLGEENIVATDLDTLDITNPNAIRRVMSEVRPSLVINAAGYTDVDGAERQKELAFALNVSGPKNLAEGCRDFGARLVHFSTDYVFSGEGREPWTEEDTPNPPKPNHYAVTKLLGENEVLENPDALILRIQWLYGRKRDRFLSLKDKTEFTPLVDQWGAPQWTFDIARIVKELVQKEARGIFHFSYDDHATWHEVYQFVVDELGLSVNLLPRTMDELALPARRPQFGVLSNKKLLRFLGWPGMGSWKDPLGEFLRADPLQLNTRVYERTRREQPETFV